MLEAKRPRVGGRRNRGTGQPSGKDRSAHEAGRGKKMRTLADLAKELPSGHDLRNYTEYLLEETDRGAAVMAAALVEKALEDAIRSRLADPGDGIQDTWFGGINAPFRSFSAKISLGRALAIYGPQMEARLGIIKNIRNAFAHRMIPLDFTHSTLVDACLKLTPDPDKNEFEARVIFGTACILLASQLGQHSLEKQNELLEITFS